MPYNNMLDVLKISWKCIIMCSKPHNIHVATSEYVMKMQLCIVLNNMQHVREELFHIEERLEFESFYRRLDSEDESTLGSQCRAMVKKLLGSADDDIYNRMSKIMAEITEKVESDVNEGYD